VKFFERLNKVTYTIQDFCVSEYPYTGTFTAREIVWKVTNLISYLELNVCVHTHIKLYIYTYTERETVCTHAGTERDISKSLTAKILLQVVSTIQVKLNSSKSLTRLCFGLDHYYIKNSTPLFSTMDLPSDTNLTISFQGTVLFRSGINLSKSYICIFPGGYTNKILRQT